MTTEEKKAFDLLLESLVATVETLGNISETIHKVIPVVHKNNVEVRNILAKEFSATNILIPH